MSALLAATAVSLAPVMLVIAAGFAWARYGRSFDTATVGPVASDLAMPCLIFSALARADMPTSSLAWSALAALICLLAFAALGSVILATAGWSLRTYLPSVTWGNAGFLGIPIALAGFGRDGMLYAVAFSSISLLFNSVFAQAVVVGRSNLRAIFATPLIYAVLGGVLVAGFHLVLPSWLLRTVSLIGDMAIPLVLLMIGASLARIRPVVFGRALAFSLVRSAGGAMLGLGVGLALGLSAVARDVLILQCAMPVAALSYVFAQKWNTDPAEVASLVAVSTWTSALSIPVILGVIISASG